MTNNKDMEKIEKETIQCIYLVSLLNRYGGYCYLDIPDPGTTKVTPYLSIRIFSTPMATPIKVFDIDDVINS